jgi:hypothetical protein
MTARRSLHVGGSRHGDVVDSDGDLPAEVAVPDEDGGELLYVAVVVGNDDVLRDLEAHGFDQVLLFEGLVRELEATDDPAGELAHQTIDADRTAGLHGEWANGEYPDD